MEQLRNEFARQRPIAERLATCLREQITALLIQNNVTLGVPIEWRVKSWESIEEKIERKLLDIATLTELSDMVGIRLILLFLPDLHLMDKLIRDNLDVLRVEDTRDRLGETQFGYQSNHYTIRIPKAWLETPSYADLGQLTAEIQVRTLAQHIWAAASHTLQYKREDSVPLPLRRTIHRISALLETIDLEFDRVLVERSDYINHGIERLPQDSPLDVDLVQSITSELLPTGNAERGDRYDLLLADLRNLGITTAEDLRNLLTQNLAAILAEDEKEVRSNLDSENQDDFERLARGVYFTHVGLAREALRKKFGNKKVNDVVLGRMEKSLPTGVSAVE